MQAIVLAAGKGTRMRSEKPKVLHEVLGRPLLEYVLQNLALLGVKKPIVVVGSGASQVRSAFAGRAQFVTQAQQKGTGHAVMMARRHLVSSRSDVLIWPGDMPLLKFETLRQFAARHRRARADVSVLSALRLDPFGYGRILRAGGAFCGIREELDASEIEKRIQEVNTGIYLFHTGLLFKTLVRVRPNNRKKEIYLTDTIEILSGEGSKLEAFPLAASDEGQGVNSRGDLAAVTKKMNQRVIQEHQSRGVTFVSPEQTFVSPGVKIGQDTVIYPWCFIEKDVRIGRGCEIGPFAKIRGGTEIGDEAVIGSFVEVNRSRIGKKVQAKHLTYLGDARVGDETNIGAGTITANFDGKKKSETRIGRKVLVGSDTVFVAPVEIGDHARTGAGAVVTGRTIVKKGEVVAGVPARPIGRKKNKKK